MVEYPPVLVLCYDTTGKLQPHQRSCSHIRANHKPHSPTTYCHTRFLVCSSPFWHSLSTTVMILDLPDVQSFPCSWVTLGTLHTRNTTSYFVSYLFYACSHSQLHSGPSWTSLLMYLPHTLFLKRHRSHEPLARGTASVITKMCSNPSSCIHPLPCDAHHVTIWSSLFILHPVLCVFPPVSCHSPKQGCGARGSQLCPCSFLML